MSAARRPVELQPAVLVHPTADRRLAIGQWLMSAHDTPSHGQVEWTQHGITLLRLGTLFSAVRLPLRLVLAVAGGRQPSQELDRILEEALEGGPVICDPAGRRYYALVPASMPRTWTQAADDWRVMDVDCLGQGTYLGVPRPDRTEYDPETNSSYWAVPMPSAGSLCAPLTVARLIAVARHQLAEEQE